MNDATAVLAYFLGSTVELGLDPVIIGIGVLVGLAAPKWWQRIPSALVFAVALTLAIRATRDFPWASPVWWVVLCRSVALVAWAVVGATIRWLIGRLQPAQSSSGSD